MTGRNTGGAFVGRRRLLGLESCFPRSRSPALRPLPASRVGASPRVFIGNFIDFIDGIMDARRSDHTLIVATPVKDLAEFRSSTLAFWDFGWKTPVPHASLS